MSTTPTPPAGNSPPTPSGNPPSPPTPPHPATTSEAHHRGFGERLWEHLSHRFEVYAALIAIVWWVNSVGNKIEKLEDKIDQKFSKANQENENLRLVLAAQSQMSNYFCHGDYEAVQRTYDDLLAKVPLDTIPKGTRDQMHMDLIGAWARRGKYERLKVDQLNRIADSLESQCGLTYQYLMICYLATGQPEVARRRGAAALEEDRQGIDPEGYTLPYYRLTLLSILTDPKYGTADERVAAGMKMLDRLENISPIGYSRVAGAMKADKNSALVRYLSLQEPGTFPEAYDGLVKQIEQNQNKVTEYEQNGIRYIRKKVKEGGKEREFHIPRGPVQNNGAMPPVKERFTGGGGC